MSGEASLYTDIIEPLGHKAKAKNEEFIEAYSKLINKFTLEFTQNYCTSDGAINWEKIVRFNSAKE